MIRTAAKVALALILFGTVLYVVAERLDCTPPETT